MSASGPEGVLLDGVCLFGQFYIEVPEELAGAGQDPVCREHDFIQAIHVVYIRLKDFIFLVKQVKQCALADIELFENTRIEERLSIHMT